MWGGGLGGLWADGGISPHLGSWQPLVRWETDSKSVQPGPEPGPSRLRALTCIDTSASPYDGQSSPVGRKDE